MADPQKLSHTSAMILQAIGSSPHLRLHRDGSHWPSQRNRLSRIAPDGTRQLIRSQWERQSIADAELRPPRKYYRLTRAGEITLDASRDRYPLLAGLTPTEEVQKQMKTQWLQNTVLLAASLLAPGDQRAEWVKEWRSELWYIPRRTALLVSLGAFRDALWLRRNNLAP